MLIIKIKKVNGSARVLLGAFAGRATIVVDVDLIDARNNEILREFEVEGKSSGGTIFAGTTKQAVEKAADEIVNHLKSMK